MQYTSQVKKLPVLLLPGTVCDHAVFGQQIRALEAVASYVEVVEFPRQRSITEMVDSVARQIPAAGTAAIAGFSMGGMVALALAGRYPERVARLALINTNYRADRPEHHAARLRHLALARKDGIEEMLAKHYVPKYLHKQDPGHQRLILDMARRLGTDCFAAQIEALATRPDSGDVLRNIHCPTLILGSDLDELCPPAVQMEMHELATGSDLLLLGACGHFSMLERPEAVCNALLNWYMDPPWAAS
jgi:pimeloyl-ACP methyl ester carboxylesterase